MPLQFVKEGLHLAAYKLSHQQSLQPAWAIWMYAMHCQQKGVPAKMSNAGPHGNKALQTAEA